MEVSVKKAASRDMTGGNRGPMNPLRAANGPEDQEDGGIYTHYTHYTHLYRENQVRDGKARASRTESLPRPRARDLCMGLWLLAKGG